eukprot:m.5986 g.5986  ORF g.5986 m.5986 type:complete len:591 (+) comp14639_c0_seq1:82-1854(+)
MTEQIISYGELSFPNSQVILGEGAYGRVQAAVWKGAHVAVKELHRIFFEEGGCQQWEEAFVRRFLEEGKVHSLLRHPNVVQCFGVSFRVNDRMPILVAELMRESLQARLNRLSLSVAETSAVACDVANGLAYIHGLGVAHRDLAPKNILLNYVPGVTAKIADLGVARNLTESQKKRLTWRPGTELYMPPEALVDDGKDYTWTIDVFSLGVVMLQMIVTRDPLPLPLMTRSDSGNGIDLVPEVVRREKDLKDVPDGHPLKDWVWRCLTDERPTSSVLADALNSIRDNIGMKEVAHVPETELVELEERLRQDNNETLKLCFKSCEKANNLIERYKTDCDDLNSEVTALKVELERTRAQAEKAEEESTNQINVLADEVGRLMLGLEAAKESVAEYKSGCGEMKARYRKADFAKAELRREVKAIEEELQLSRWSEIVLSLEKETTLANIRLEHENTVKSMELEHSDALTRAREEWRKEAEDEKEAATMSLLLTHEEEMASLRTELQMNHRKEVDSLVDLVKAAGLEDMDQLKVENQQMKKNEEILLEQVSRMRQAHCEEIDQMKKKLELQKRESENKSQIMAAISSLVGKQQKL